VRPPSLAPGYAKPRALMLSSNSRALNLFDHKEVAKKGAGTNGMIVPPSACLAGSNWSRTEKPGR
jgi:hypothetical protein